METQMAGSISRLDGNMSQDAVFKDILAYKEVLAHMRCTPGQVIQILEEEYDFSSARNMEGTVTAVCNLSQGFIEEGRERGMKEGRERGMREGRAQGADQERLRSIRSLMETTGSCLCHSKHPTEKFHKMGLLQNAFLQQTSF